MQSCSNSDWRSMKFRSLLNSANAVKVSALVSLANLVLSILWFLTWNVDPEQTAIHPDLLELGKFAGEMLPQDIALGAPLTKPSTKTLQKSFRSPSCDDGTFGDENKNHSFKNICPSDIFFSVRSSKKYHISRLKVLIDTWISIVPENVRIFTDHEDDWLNNYLKANMPKASVAKVIVTDCPQSTDDKWSLLCKLYWAYRTFLVSDKKWFCHFDDDSYVNVKSLVMLLNVFPHQEQIYIGRSPSSKPVVAVAYDTESVRPEIWMLNDTSNDTTWKTPLRTFQRVGFHFALGGAGFCFTRQLALDMKESALGSRMLHSASSISLPDDCVIGYIITHLLRVPLIHIELMHAHLEDLAEISEGSLEKQVTLSYRLTPGSKSMPDNAENTAFFRDRTHRKYHSANHGRANTINLRMENVISNDPTRFLSVHKLITRNNNIHNLFAMDENI